MLDTPHLVRPKDGPAPRWFHVAVAASMIISALAALIATLHTGRTMSALVEQNARLVRANSTPVLQFGHGNLLADGAPGQSLPGIEFSLTNAGTGLARIVWFELRLDGKPLPEMRAAVRALSAADVPRVSFITSPVAGQLLAARERNRFFAWERPAPDDANALTVWKQLEQARFQRIGVQTCYCSVFEECWISNLDGAPPQPVAACDASGRVSLAG